MRLIEITTFLLEKITARKLRKAEERNTKAINRVKQAKRDVEKTAFQYRSAQVDVLVQLTRLRLMESNISIRSAIQEKKTETLTALLQQIES